MLVLLLYVGFISFIIVLLLSNRQKARAEPGSIAIFHPFWYSVEIVNRWNLIANVPFSNAGGGGERVLWSVIQSLQKSHPSMNIVVYIEDCSLADDQIVTNAKKKFNLDLKSERLQFIRLKLAALLKGSSYPRLTMIGQLVGSAIVGLEARLRYSPSLLLDTLGNAFVYPAFFFLQPPAISHGKRLPILAYVHYPLISNDMIERVRRGHVGYNNECGVSKSRWLTRAKILYYQCLLKIYSLCGQMVSLAMANSSWTLRHLQVTWPETRIELVYPPCDVASFTPKASSGTQRTRHIVSLSQFRPEKNHRLQLEAMALVLKRGIVDVSATKLILVGGCRDAEDEERVRALEELSVDLGIGGMVRFEVNVAFPKMVEHLQTALIGLHTMQDEHFGISLVEFMASGLITIAHRSGGPLTDIVDDGVNGFLASEAEQYAVAIEKVLGLAEGALEAIRRAAKQKATAKFSMPIFRRSLHRSLAPYLKGSDNKNK